MAEGNEQDQGAPEAVGAARGGDKSKSTVIMLIVMSVLVMVLTPVITIFTIKTMAPKQEQAVVASTNKSKEIKLSGISVNIADTAASRYARLDIVFEVDDPKDIVVKLFEERSDANPHGMLNRIKAEVINIISDKPLDSLLSSESKNRLAEDIQNKLNEILFDKMQGGRVSKVFFPMYLIQ